MIFIVQSSNFHVDFHLAPKYDGIYLDLSIALVMSVILWLIRACYFLSTSAVVSLFYIFSSRFWSSSVEQSSKPSGLLNSLTLFLIVYNSWLRASLFSYSSLTSFSIIILRLFFSFNMPENLVFTANPFFLFSLVDFNKVFISWISAFFCS